MADPRLYLPPVLSDDIIRKLVSELSLPEPTTIKPLITTAAYHTIYLIIFSPADADALYPARSLEEDGSIALVLRVAGKHIPRIKTLNEVAAMTWVRENCKIPIPAVIRFDASENNAIGYEFTLLERVRGVSVDTIYDKLDDGKIAKLVSQLTDYLIEIHRHEWTHAGGISIDENNNIVPGRVLAENFWQGPEIAQYWGGDATIDLLNVHGPFSSYTDYLQGHIQQYVRNIERHESLEWMRDMIPRLEKFLTFAQDHAAELNDAKYILTHKDLHFGNIMCDPETLEITSILDWEFAAVLPLPLWSPGGGFLWSAKDESPASFAERDRLFKDIFSKICKERSPALLADFDVKNQDPHKSIVKVLNFVRAIVEVCPRGKRLEMARTWRSTVEQALQDLGI
ncbi:hypothetical protein PFICI_14526 [Pestalotiopsis fici W106-1]|uniref:Aminoglycoside phosphotransferase domain-containing protein n=1 Tax=Pestalotiopsis fici (strain W106-1 / CGMCC3.15140) TaxID=1229662 RepID=W3WI18_PESFW|nr:uncharacterized protein PFICI_14526 [Pestalotiopsis fici W106-1]ETS73580.1 hypothetical protein PFICI_14526 [Pestalotiopsis fici W106-1]